nr:MAG TPA: hypothetical protein [Caudoviricetes sp.]
MCHHSSFGSQCSRESCRSGRRCRCLQYGHITYRKNYLQIIPEKTFRRNLKKSEKRKEREYMSQEEKKEKIINLAQDFTKLDDEDKAYIVGYMAGKTEERQRWEQKVDAVEGAAS